MHNESLVYQTVKNKMFFSLVWWNQFSDEIKIITNFSLLFTNFGKQ